MARTGKIFPVLFAGERMWPMMGESHASTRLTMAISGPPCSSACLGPLLPPSTGPLTFVSGPR
eukprot:13227370-Alexandrium_andersonii.AAC.1